MSVGQKQGECASIADSLEEYRKVLYSESNCGSVYSRGAAWGILGVEAHKFEIRQGCTPLFYSNVVDLLKEH